jgi:oxygen-independent coproporphyrinogen-3 oxidase
MALSGSPTGLYVHVPFCAQKCAYCAFYSEASTGDLVNRYVSALVRELESLPKFLPASIFFGGGTPSILNLQQWETILKALQDRGFAPSAEFTVECNPATVSPDKARLLRSGGVNRISMGVQSLDEALLDRLGRVHSRDMVFKSYDILRQAGFDNLNLDLMFAIPGQTFEVWRSTLREALELEIEHLSTYEVIYEDDTPLFQQLSSGEIEIDEDLACRMYEELVEGATRAGLVQYEIANFGRPLPGSTDEVPHRACRHNINYWRGGGFHGVGPSATAYVNGRRTKNWSNTRMYCELIEKGQEAFESTEVLPPLQRAGETAAFGLRMVRGWGFEEFAGRTGFDLRKEWRQEMNELASKQWGSFSDTGFRLTREGLRFADYAAELFLR